MIFLFKRFNRKQVIFALLILIYCFYQTVNSYGQSSLIYHLKILFPFVQLIAFVFLTEKERLKAFEYFKKIFCALVFLGLLTYPVAMLKLHFLWNEMPLQSESLAWSNGGFYYKNYIFAIYTANDNTSLGYVGRFCGVFNEPGVIGTFSALFLVADGFDLMKRDNVVLLLGGLLSLSFAFYMMVGIYLICCSGLIRFVLEFKNKKLLFIFLFLFFIIIALLWVSNSSFRSILSELIIARFRRFFGGIDNRTTELFDMAFSSFIRYGTITEHLFGHGYGAVVFNKEFTNTSSYKTQIYDLGYVGLSILYFICMYATALNPVKDKKKKFTLLGIFLLSTYQRIGVLNLSYLSILLCGGNCLWNSKKMR